MEIAPSYTVTLGSSSVRASFCSLACLFVTTWIKMSGHRRSFLRMG